MEDDRDPVIPDGIEMIPQPEEIEPDERDDESDEQDVAPQTRWFDALGHIILALAHLILCILWLGPAIVLLILNSRGHVIGASIGCFSCYLNPFSNATFEEEARLGRRDHDVLGALQLAAKALEIVFIAVVSGILYDAMVLVVARGGDFPIGLLRRYIQFADVQSFFDYPKGTKTKRHHAFIILAGFLCLLVNLLLPTLQWRDEAIRSLGLFNKMASNKRPRDTDIAADCTGEMLASGNYSCTEKPYAHSLDQLFASLSGSLEQIGQTEIIFDPVIIQEGQVSFVVNTTDLDVDWIPTRQVAREVSDEYVRYANGVSGNRKSNYTRLSNSLSTTLLRDGPTLGLAGGCYRGALSTATIATDKSIRCFGGWILYAEPGTQYTRCIRVGDGWNGSTNIHSRFYLGDEGSTAGPVTVDVYFADKVYTPSVHDDDPQCFIDGYPQTNSSCDWDKAFLTDLPTPRVQNTSTNIIIVEYTVPTFSSTNRTIWCDNIVYLGFQKYSMDPNPFSNFIHLTQLYSHVQSDTTPLVVDTNWILAGWSVNTNGTVDGTRIAPRTMIKILKDTLQDNTENLDLSTLNYMDGVAANQGLSMIDYSINSTATTNRTAVPTSVDHRQLRTSVKIHVWAYGLGSSTSKIGATVVIIGSVCVLLRTFTILWRVKVGYTPMKALKELLIEALEYEPGHVPEQGIEEQNMRASFAVVGTKIWFRERGVRAVAT
ncbi:MAG: hypothetical protein M1840_003078 [Geoglossum simile]|nr:MAG: hypothetical protein M1840_003078 [Geoglossum simile]